MFPVRTKRRLIPLATAAVVVAATLAVAVQARPALAASTATINGGTTFQTITGFGASEAFGEALTAGPRPASGAAGSGRS
jgi:hypothetical protein